MEIPLVFDYNALDETALTFTYEQVGAVHNHLVQIGQEVMDMGFVLLEVKKHLTVAQFKRWVRVECDLSYMTATRYMRIAERLGGKERLRFLPITLLNELAMPSTPDGLIAAVEAEQIELSLQAIRAAKHQSKMHALDSIFPGISRMPITESAVLPDEDRLILE